ncbi:unnamed protein product [Fructobacillus tropaeoli]|uniref:hypothetical protein n=1 Tax=Fructobacillus tropaeoli TaxID=709323 RepID=UPI002DAA9588|nr:unnamed protein product [Fructobacillus tropaeoli]
MADKKWWFQYDPQSFAFVPGAILAEEQPDNTTDVEPSGVMNPVWNPSTKTWTGESIENYLAEHKANAKQQTNPQQQLAQLSMQVMQLMRSNAELTARVKAFETKEGNNV